MRDQVPAPLVCTYQERRECVYCLSPERRIGRLLMEALTNPGLAQAMREASSGLGEDFDKL